MKFNERRCFRALLGVVFCLTSVLGSSGCRPGRKASSLRVSGAWALYPLMVRWADVYQRSHPGVRVDVAAGGAGKGLADCMAGLVDVGMVSRDLRPEETGAGLVAVPVARDAVFAVVSAANPCAPELLRRGLARRVLAEWYLGEGKGTWDQAAPGAGGGELRLYTRSDACGAAETWARFLGGRQEDLRGIGAYGDPGLADAVRRDPHGLGFSNLGFAFDPATGRSLPGLVVVPLDLDGGGGVDAREDVSTRDKALAAIRSGAYPAPPARELHLVVKGTPRPEVAAFLAWIRGPGQRLAAEAGFLPVADPRP